MTSMTGYAYVEETGETYTVSVEIKSYNSRFLDLTINLPSFLGRLETFFREKITPSVLRGKTDVSIRIREETTDTRVSVDTAAARAYADAIGRVAEALGRGDANGAAGVPLSLIVQQEGVLVSHREFDLECYRTLIEPVFTRALTAFIADRRREGENLRTDLFAKIAELDAAAAFFAEWQPRMELLFRESITRRFNELLGDAADPQRVMTEIAAMLVKYTINEEIVRLQSHLAALKTELAENPAPGRKIDFICQEINREINTIGSKNQFPEVGAMVITAKNALENIREQARNVE
ncbi:YicC/YloC family endoribonuclease [Treponema brennaborense]|uniref:YicC-like domain-containing protein n=1 Tax=Treponema brennaborense (strain DSM 12168 / CIP 105900 / DD5/3) TaxID=906968 RepID=F4LL11_TREBD|nr:YicC/YloC family endoribonuclease [Treponema brennaborense]AEE16608.1 Conserved hypothetical protein CHP00255 [Treponema brennaborense DSM 12168]